MRLLVDAVRNVSDWHNLGLHLDITMRKLKEIDRIYRVDGEERIKAEMFDVWLKSCPDASWHKLVSALNAINEKRVAKEVESHFCKQLPGNELHYNFICAFIITCTLIVLRSKAPPGEYIVYSPAVGNSPVYTIHHWVGWVNREFPSKH